MCPSCHSHGAAPRRGGGTIAIWPPTIHSLLMNTPFGTRQVLLDLDWTPEQEPLRGLWETRRNCVQLMHSFAVCQQQQLRTRVSLYWVATNSFGHFLELRHSGFLPLCPWQILVRGCFCWALSLCCWLCFSAWWRNANLAGGSACRLLWCFCLCLFCVVDLPYYMTTDVNVDFISNCFFTCKDRALERDRPYQKKRKKARTRQGPDTQIRTLTPLVIVTWRDWSSAP